MTQKLLLAASKEADRK